jgi:3-hydroxymyristoyl/3-hydroxydecanoyl-(acyl carrier protein) dehydratase
VILPEISPHPRDLMLPIFSGRDAEEEKERVWGFSNIPLNEPLFPTTFGGRTIMAWFA